MAPNTKLQDLLRSELRPGEVVLRTLDAAPGEGFGTSLLALTNRRLLVLTASMNPFSKPTVGRVMLEDVMTLSVVKGDSMGVWDLFIEARSGGFNVRTGSKGRREAEDWPNHVLSAQRALQGPPDPTSPTSTLGDAIAGQLAQLAELHDRGALTATEFSAAKAALLGVPAPLPASVPAATDALEPSPDGPKKCVRIGCSLHGSPTYDDRCPACEHYTAG